MKEIRDLIWKDIKLELRQQSTLNTMVLFMVCTIFLCYISFMLKIQVLESITWNTLFWIILVFSAVNSAGNSFRKESTGRQLYYYQLAKPESIIMAKIIFNFLLLLVLSLLGFALYLALLGNPVQDFGMYFLSLILGSLGFSASLTLLAGIASKTDNASGILAVLSFPVLLPLINMLIRLSKNAMDGLDVSASYDEILTIFGIDLIVIALSYLLFPYLWKS
ncbi:heme exporter protein CcmB [Leadbetterella byssophila]|uniref:Cytochrome c-type biogenesis protein CcmB n=1 Tax=Leadbetterella byssophila (strain DSM 17132 / JCM 16389 / KACC 11308 / NBRC 106382 / 4M15) TaxID=649349 RepID=E4RQ28_LEAB4|nr:heme exporter protein CcmB [Leadbetterella byssophila]ADQ16511.1 cytochrome c-type biogenesis protein CcmB [Leadbetterella byssophila DSM 17132]